MYEFGVREYIAGPKLFAIKDSKGHIRQINR